MNDRREKELREQYISARINAHNERIERRKERDAIVEQASTDLYNAKVFADMGKLDEANLYASLATAKYLSVIAGVMTERN